MTDIEKLFRPRAADAHKGTFGHGLLIGGSYGMAGAAVLGARAALRSGAGLVSVAIPPENISIIQTSVPEAIMKIYDTCPKNLEKYNAIAVGPGISTNERTFSMLRLLLKNNQRPMIFDADAINIIAAEPTLLSLITAGSIFTPHIKEYERLMAAARLDTTATSDAARADAAKIETANVDTAKVEAAVVQQAFSNRFGCVVIRKGVPNTITVPNCEPTVIKTGNPGMATAGSGDVLTGILLGLTAQGYNAHDAAILGVYIHGSAGNLAAAALSQTSMIASDIIEYLPQVFLQIEKRANHFLRDSAPSAE
ncbi:MAG: NAD(P)H-hydrate dehydratase [Bacteroidales bacterium]|jgi:NAD(P)H-hydrate epimerase|nr:NAD(P)H-hydrate dehydratase [Bacteroidales bacterium]